MVILFVYKLKLGGDKTQYKIILSEDRSLWKNNFGSHVLQCYGIGDHQRQFIYSFLTFNY